MATPPEFLATLWRAAAGNQQVLLYDVGADVSQLGSDLASDATLAGANANSALRNYAIKYAGRIFTMGEDGIYEKDDPTTDTGAFTRVLTFTSRDTGSTGSLIRTGLFPMKIGSSPRLIGLYGTTTTTSNWRAVIYNPATNSWSQGADQTVPGPTPITFLSDAITYNNTLHVIGNASNVERAFVYDPATDGFTGLTEPFPSNDLPTGMFIHKNRLLAIATDGTDVRLAEFSGGAWSFIATLETHPSSGTGADLTLKFAGWSDGTDIRVVYMTSYAGGSNGWRVTKVNDTTYVETNISAILPSSLRHSDDGGTFSGDKRYQRMWVLTDMQTDPTSPKVYLYHTTDARTGGTYSVYEYIDDSTEMTTPVDTGGDSYGTAIPSGGGQHIGGSRFWTNTTAGHLDSLITDASEGTDDITFTYRGYNDSGGSRTLTVYFSTDGGLTLTQATLSAATGGSSSLSGNTVINVDPDGTTDYTVTVDYGLSSINDGDRVQFYLQLA